MSDGTPQARSVRALDAPLADAGPYVIASGGTGPNTRELVLTESPTHEFGIWECQPGSWWEDTGDVDEVFHVVAGRGRIVSDAGEITELVAGQTVHVPPHWRGRWEVEETIRKIHALKFPASDGEAD
jgi:hypothetical protein